MAIRILIVDDHEILRSGLTLLIDGNPEMEVIGTAENGLEAVNLSLQLKPDIVLMDVSMPVMDGLEATKKIKKALPNTEVLILTMLDESEHLEEILTTGASGYLIKTYGEKELFAAIHSVYSHLPYLYPHAMKHLMKKKLDFQSKTVKTPPKQISRTSPLTEREHEVLLYVCQGFYNKEIAEKLSISVKTVEAHKSRIMTKLQLFTRHELVKYAENIGLLSRKSEDE
ncbi:response regulator [Paenibacillus puldeungensis]|uniref:Response regulator n=1 Tax=Paenibacillus puldeungensis TaxID=696536 RepID=A0ABW3RYP0_9BACL